MIWKMGYEPHGSVAILVEPESMRREMDANAGGEEMTCGAMNRGGCST